MTQRLCCEQTKQNCELGNLQSEGHGISGFATMLSIGLGQEQQFTLILQTLQQLRDVYGDSVDKIVQGNTSNIVIKIVACIQCEMLQYAVCNETIR